MAPVKGQVVANGRPVTEGTLVFSPLAETVDAASANGAIQPDGTFVLGTNSLADGAAVGRHRVLYNAPPPSGPEWDGYGKPPERTFSPFQGFIPRESEVEVKAGPNEITIELMPGQ